MAISTRRARGQFFDVKQYKKILVVDDSVVSGSALNECRENLKEFSTQFDIKYCAVYVAPGKEKTVDYYFEVVPLPRYFQWNILNHTTLEKPASILTGFFALTRSRNRTMMVLGTASSADGTALFIPGAKIGTIVTSRLEKYRKETEQWLRKTMSVTNELIMLDLPNMEARQKANAHGTHSIAKAYMAKPYVLFVESEPHQAMEINRLSGKPVLYCQFRDGL